MHNGKQLKFLSYYCNWQEASVAAVRLNIRSMKEYEKKYKLDGRLCRKPKKMYSNFPGWVRFLNKKVDFYKTWQEASVAAIKLNITSFDKYSDEYQKDPLLPSGPPRFYKDFPGWNIFLKKQGFYKTWQEASDAAVALKIKNCLDLRNFNKHDSRLHNAPNKFYPDFPGWDIFLKREITDKRKRNMSAAKRYETWQEAAEAAKKIGIKNCSDWKFNYKKDPLLCSYPKAYYSDFTSWKCFKEE